MILKGNQRGGGKQLALHLLNTDQNDHVTVLEVSNFSSDDLVEAMQEAHAMCNATKAKKYLYSLSLNPPYEFDGDKKLLIDAVERAEKALGLEGQPRAIVTHEKEGRIHAHAAWSLIDAEELKKIKIYRDHNKLHDLSKDLYLEHNWKLPEGFINKDLKNPLNYSRDEYQQALRTNQKPKELKANIQECWAISDSKKAFESALQSRGYALAQGTRRSYVVVDCFGEVYSLPRQLGKTKKDMEPRLGNSQDLPSIDQAKELHGNQLMMRLQKEREALAQKQRAENLPLVKAKKSMIEQQRMERQKGEEQRKARWAEEERNRSERLRRGYKGLWDKLTGSYQRTRKRNEHETEKCLQRDRTENQQVIKKQLSDRKVLQAQIDQQREQQKLERFTLYRNTYKHLKKLDRQQELRSVFEQLQKEKAHKPRKDIDLSFEPEI